MMGVRKSLPYPTGPAVNVSQRINLLQCGYEDTPSQGRTIVLAQSSPRLDTPLLRLFDSKGKPETGLNTDPIRCKAC